MQRWAHLKSGRGEETGIDSNRKPLPLYRRIMPSFQESASMTVVWQSFFFFFFFFFLED